MANSKLNIISFNGNGLSDRPKRITVFKWLKRNFKGIFLLQESHSSIKTQICWQKDIGHQFKAFFSHGTTAKKGVCTMIPKSLVKKVCNVEQDENGRILAIQIVIDKIKYTIINVYLPTQNFMQDQINTLDKLDSMMDNFNDSVIIVGGDFNIIQDPALDKYDPKPNEKPSKAANRLEELKFKYNLNDIWRVQNPRVKRYTWRRRTPLQQSRLDFWLVKDTINGNIAECDIGQAYRSDHNLINIQCATQKTVPRGKGFWKVNNSLLEDQAYIDLITTKVADLEPELQEISDDRLAWEFIKMVIRRETISYAV